MHNPNFLVLVFLFFFHLKSFAYQTNYSISNNLNKSDPISTTFGNIDQTPCPNSYPNYLDNTIINCGQISVPSDHSNQHSQLWKLSFVKLSKDENLPLLIIDQGGPGFSSMDLAIFFAKQEVNLLSNFQIVAIEQRGLERNYPNAVCNVAENENLEDCYIRVKKLVNLKLISSYQMAADRVTLAQSLGYKQFNFLGVSYGTVIGQYLAHYFPKFIKNIVLDSPVKLGQFNAHLVKGDFLFSKNLNSFIEKMKSHSYWEYNYNETLRNIRYTAIGLDKKPFVFEYERDGKKLVIKFDGELYSQYLLKLLIFNYNPWTLFDYLRYLEYWSDYSNDNFSKPTTELLTQLINRYSSYADNKIDVIFQNIICSEFTIEKLPATAYFGEEIKKAIPEIHFQKFIWQHKKRSEVGVCDLGIKPSSDKRILKQSIFTNKPVLLAFGERDHITYFETDKAISKNMVQSKTIIYKSVGHGVFNNQKCINREILHFLKNGTYAQYCE